MIKLIYWSDLTGEFVMTMERYGAKMFVQKRMSQLQSGENLRESHENVKSLIQNPNRIISKYNICQR